MSAGDYMTFVGGIERDGEWTRINGVGEPWGSDGFGGWGSYDAAVAALTARKGYEPIPGGVLERYERDGFNFAHRIVLRSFMGDL